MASQIISKWKNIDAEIVALTDLAMGKERGSIVTHDEIEAATKIERDSKLHSRLIRNWKKQMLRRGVWVKAATPLGAGYRILTIREQSVEEPQRLKKQGMKKIDAAAMCVGAIPADLLDEDGNALQTAVLGQFAELKAQDKTQRALVASWLANPKTLPRANGKAIS